MPCSPTVPTDEVARREVLGRVAATRRASTATTPGTTCSRSRGAAPCRRRRTGACTSASTDSGVASRRQSRPQVVQRTVRSRSRFAARTRAEREDAERRPEPTRHASGRVGDGSYARVMSSAADAWGATQHVAVRDHRAPRSRDRRRRPRAASAGRTAHHVTEHEERGLPSECVEHTEELRAWTRDRARRRR